MSKPDYLKHDIDTANDPAIIKMRVKFGSKGYGLFWLIVEYLRKTDDGRASLSDIGSITFSSNEPQKDLEEFINACINCFGLFKSDGTYFWSDRLCRDMKAWDVIGSKRGLSGKVGAWRKNYPDEPIPQKLVAECIAQGIAVEESYGPKDSDDNLANAKQMPEVCHSKKQQNKTNKKKSNLYTPFKFKEPSIEEVKAYCLEQENEVIPEQFINYYQSNGWKVGKNPMKDWKAAVRNWECNSRNINQAPKAKSDDSVRMGKFLDIPTGGNS
jgi:hypothetical protein